MYKPLRLALSALVLVACARPPKPNPVITVVIPLSEARTWSADSHPPATYVLERIWLDPTQDANRCLRTQGLGHGSVDSYQWTCAGLVLRIRREMPALPQPMQWVFSRSPNEAPLSYPVLRGNDTDSMYHELMSAPACSMTF